MFDVDDGGEIRSRGAWSDSGICKSTGTLARGRFRYIIWLLFRICWSVEVDSGLEGSGRSAVSYSISRTSCVHIVFDVDDGEISSRVAPSDLVFRKNTCMLIYGYFFCALGLIHK